MKKFSANYSYSNHNFVIQNLEGERIDNEYLPAVCILKNILQRGKPTLLSSFLQSKLGAIHKDSAFEQPYPLIDREVPQWERIIRGDEKGNYNPAKKFYEKMIPKYLPEFSFIQQLIIPEVEINEITQVEVDEFKSQQVDFYLPQAYLIIEIDGFHHETEEEQKEKDEKRDSHTKKYGIETIRIKTSDLENENDVFLGKIEDIKERIQKAIKGQEKRRQDGDKTFISLNAYQKAFEERVDLSNPHYRATAIVRFQILLLELLERGVIDFKQPWKFEILERDVNGFAELAIEDLFIWLEHLFKLQKIEFAKPEVEIQKVQEFSSNGELIKIDFSLLKRYTDEPQLHQGTIFVRTDYLDEFRYFKKGKSNEIEFSSIESYDYFKVSTHKPIKYELNREGKDSDEESLRFLLWNIFLQNNENLSYDTLQFREGQLPIIVNALIRNDTIGLLPTGAGKSVCYQLACILQPSINFVVCPIKALMYDQKADLDGAYFSRTNYITSDGDREDGERTMKEFGKGRYFFILISPERFQIQAFRSYLKQVNEDFTIAYAVIDEVHCLSEWGHDFRTSYLNLANAIRNHCSNFKFIGLTATASINVLKDIQIEFEIKDRDVKTLPDYSRKELDFIVIDDNGDKKTALNSQLHELRKEGALEEDGSNTKCGIIFTPNVSRANGCYDLSLQLKKEFNRNIEFFSGSRPKRYNGDFETYKKGVQTDFKHNKFSLLAATKSFGMGLNKGNIHYTFHYGIPQSMEALYQEAGRAGRDKIKFEKEKAKCFVLLSKSNNDKGILDKIWDKRTPLSKIRNLYKQTGGDINTNLHLFLTNLEVISEEFDITRNLHKKFSIPNKKNVKIEGKAINCNKAKTEKAIYRLSQLGIVEDWTINNFFGDGAFTVDFADFSEQLVKESLRQTITKYDNEFSFAAIRNSSATNIYSKILRSAPADYTEIDKHILFLLQWSYDNITYNRRQSLKKVYEDCCELADGKITREQFKTRIENYFKFSESSDLLQEVSENPENYQKWFKTFYKLGNMSTANLIQNKEQQTLRDGLARFLETYKSNTGLDLISGLLRLLLDDYENTDGKIRLESALENIQRYNPTAIEHIINQTLKIGKQMDDKNKTLLAKSLHKFFNHQEFLIRLSKELNDSYSMTKFIEQANDRLSKVKEVLNDGLKEVG